MDLRGAWRAAVALALLQPAAAAAEPVGFLALVDPPVELRGGAAGSFKAAGVDQEVSVGDAIRTGREALAKLVLGDDTAITIDEETEIEVDQWLVGGNEPSRIELLSGHVRTVVGERFGPRTRMELITPTSVIGVKGTEWLTWWVQPDLTTWVCVVTGVVAASGRDLAAPGTIDLGAGQCAKISKGETPEVAPLPPNLDPVGHASGSGEEQGGSPNLPPDTHDPDRPVITGDDNVGREFDIPEPDPPPVPQPEPDPLPVRDPQPDPQPPPIP
jgi:ferric-dicitrate binding protein FerR (iron transport regulator)